MFLVAVYLSVAQSVVSYVKGEWGMCIVKRFHFCILKSRKGFVFFNLGNVLFYNLEKSFCDLKPRKKLYS